MTSNILLSKEAHAAAAELDVVLEESPVVAQLVEDMLRPESLPPGWMARFDMATGRREYRSSEADGEVQYEHPLIAYYRGAAFMERGGYKQMLDLEAAHPPVAAEVMDMFAYLGVQPHDDPYVKEVAQMAISAPMPDGWEEGEDADGNLVYSNATTGQSQSHHPLDAYFLELIQRRRMEVKLRANNVGMRSAMASQRLSRLGVDLPEICSSICSSPDASFHEGYSSQRSTFVNLVTAAGLGGVIEEGLGESGNDESGCEGGEEYSQEQSPSPLSEQEIQSAITELAAAESAADAVLAATAAAEVTTGLEQQNGHNSETASRTCTEQEGGGVQLSDLHHQGMPNMCTEQDLDRHSPQPGLSNEVMSSIQPPVQQSLRSSPSRSSPHRSGIPMPPLGHPTSNSGFADSQDGTAYQPPHPQPSEGCVLPSTSLIDLGPHNKVSASSQQMSHRQQAPNSLSPGPSDLSSSSRLPGQSSTAQPQHRRHPHEPHHHPRFMQNAWVNDPGAVPPTHDPRRTLSFSAYERGKGAPPSASVWGSLHTSSDDGAVGLTRDHGGGGGGVEGRQAAIKDLRAGVKGGAASEKAPPPTRERVRAAIRVRPPTKANDLLVWTVDQANATMRLKEGIPYRHQGGDRTFHFDIVMPPQTTTLELFTAHVQPLLQNALLGVNCTVFAYGQTGSGKTHTIFGAKPGDASAVIGLALTHLFDELAARSKVSNGAEEYRLKLSMLELYNEALRDLLISSNDRLLRGGNLALVDDAALGVRVSGLSEEVVTDARHAMALVERGVAQRSIGATAMNETSSRSHTIVRLHIETLEPLTRDLRSTALVNFVDLAGSERLAKTGSTGVRFTEGTNINLSLLMLGTVVARLAEGRRGDFIPYRNSKLTRLLQPCLGGNARTAIVATINPSLAHCEESFNTLLFATRAMAVVNQVTVNRVSKVMVSADMGRAAAELRKQVAALQAQLASKEVKGTDARVSKLEQEKARLLDRLEGLTGQPLGNIYDELPPTPPDLSLPNGRPHPREAKATPELALRSVARIAFMGRELPASTTTPSRGRNGAETVMPQEVVMAVRQMRAERDELRRRDAKLRTQVDSLRAKVSTLQPYAAEHAVVEELACTLDDLFAGDAAEPPSQRHSRWHEQRSQAMSGEGGPSAVERLREGVESMVLLHSELSNIQRQFFTSETLLSVAEARAKAAEAAADGLRGAVQRQQAQEGQQGPGGQGGVALDMQQLVSDLEGQLGCLRDENDALKAQIAAWRGFADENEPLAAHAPTTHNTALGSDQPSSPHQAQAHAEVYLPFGILADGGAAVTGMSLGGRTMVGSLAIRAARDERARAKTLAQQLAAVTCERDALSDRLAQIEAAAAVDEAAATAALLRPGNGHRPVNSTLDGSVEVGPDGMLLDTRSDAERQQVQRFDMLKGNIKRMVREVAALTRERDQLLGLLLAQQQAIVAGDQNTLATTQDVISQVFSFASQDPDAPRPPFHNGLLSSPLLPTIANGRSHFARGAPDRVWGSPARAPSLINSPVRVPAGLRSPGSHGGSSAGGVGIRSLVLPSGTSGGMPGDAKPSFELREVPLELRNRMMKESDNRAQLKAHTQLPSTASSAASSSVPILPDFISGKPSEIEVHGLKRKLVNSERSRAEQAAKSAAELRAAQLQLNASARAAGAAAKAAAERYRHLEMSRDEEVEAIKEEAANVISALLADNSKLKGILAGVQLARR